MFPKLKNIETGFRQMRRTSILLTIICVFVSCSSLYYAYKSQGRVYILLGGAIMEASVADRKEYIPLIAKSHICAFHQAFWTLEPDEKVIKNNIEHALYLADASAKHLFDDLREAGYYSAIISGNVSQSVTIDSIDLNTNSYPFPFKCWAKEKILRTTSVTTRNLLTSGLLRTTGRSPNNDFGFLIEKLEVLDNKDLSTQKR